MPARRRWPARSSGCCSTTTVRDRHGPPRPVRPDDIAILFRARAGHQWFESALAARGIRSYVYKGLGFFDAPEVQDLQALLRFLAQPDSDLRAAEFLRSRLVRLSDVALVQLAGRFSDALIGAEAEMSLALSGIDAHLLALARVDVARWLAAAERLPPSELLDQILRDSAYVFEVRGRRLDQARENIKKLRALLRRVESRGYATLDRLAAYFETLRAGDESNAILEAAGCREPHDDARGQGPRVPDRVPRQSPCARSRAAGGLLCHRARRGRPARGRLRRDGRDAPGGAARTGGTAARPVRRGHARTRPRLSRRAGRGRPVEAGGAQHRRPVATRVGRPVWCRGRARPAGGGDLGHRRGSVHVRRLPARPGCPQCPAPVALAPEEQARSSPDTVPLTSPRRRVGASTLGTGPEAARRAEVRRRCGGSAHRHAGASVARGRPARPAPTRQADRCLPGPDSPAKN